MSKRYVWLIAVLAAAAADRRLRSDDGRRRRSAPRRRRAHPPGGRLGHRSPVPATPTTEPISVGELPTDPNDWRALGPAAQASHLIEYSDFQMTFCAR